MKVDFNKIGALTIMVAVLTACGGGKGLQPPVNAGSGPDEFLVLPGKPLQTPASYSDLPPPTPDGSNAADATPRADAVAALGGNPTALSRAGIPAADSALLAHASRYGVPANIRQDLAQADKAFRRRRGGLGFLRLFSGNRYVAAYKRMALDAYRELEKLRAAGVGTPSAPPRSGR